MKQYSDSFADLVDVRNTTYYLDENQNKKYLHKCFTGSPITCSCGSFIHRPNFGIFENRLIGNIFIRSTVKSTEYIILKDSNEEHRLIGFLHRNNNPAIILSKIFTTWSKNGLKHRLDGPAHINNAGNTSWFKNGKYHREDGPAISHPDGGFSWLKDGKLHRDDGPAVIYGNGKEEFYLDGVKQG